MSQKSSKTLNFDNGLFSLYCNDDTVVFVDALDGPLGTIRIHELYELYTDLKEYFEQEQATSIQE